MTASYAQVLRFFRLYIWPGVYENRARVALSLLLLFLATGLFILGMELSRLVIQAVQQQLGAGLPADAVRWVGGAEAADLLAAAAVLCIATFSASSLVAYLRDMYFEEIALALTVSLRKKLFAHLLATPVAVFRTFESALLVKRAIQDLASVRMILVEAIMLRSADLALSLGLLAYLFSLDVALTSFSVFLIACYFAAAEISARLIGPGLYRIDSSNEQMTSHLNLAFQRFLDIKSNQAEAREQSQFDALADADYAVRRKTIKLLMLDRSLSGWLSAILPITVTFLGGFWVLGGSMQLDKVLVFVAAINMLTHTVERLTEIPMIISRSSVSVQNVEQLLLLPQETAQRLEEQYVIQGAPVVAAHNFERKLSENHLLRIDALEIRAGEKVAVIGPSGCGKSSLFASLLKFDDEYRGSLQVMGLEVGRAGTDAVRSSISYMHQHALLLHAGLHDNVHYSRDTAASDAAEIERAVRAVNLGELLDEAKAADLAHLSGGQKRRLCLARALYRHTPLLLLDEPLTGVSPAVSKEIIGALLKRSEALVMATHQYEELHRFDRVILLEVAAVGDTRVTRVAGQDRHEALLQNIPAYRGALARG